MNKHTNKHHNNNANDEDISKLFEHQPVELPTALDKLILDNAAIAVQKNSSAKRSAWIAVAAMLVIGIGLYPLLNSMQTNVPPFSEAPLPASGVQVESTVSDQDTLLKKAEPGLSAPSAVVETTRLRSEKVYEGVEAIELEAPAADDIQASPMIAPSNAVTVAQETEAPIRSHVKSTEPKELGYSAEADDITSYRRTAQSWIDKIMALYNEDDKAFALDELNLFDKQYPNHDLVDTLPTSLRLAFDNQ